MSKTNNSRRFRGVDVDQYDEERYIEEEADDTSSGPNESEINQLLAQNKNSDALMAVLANPPVSSKNQALKDKCAQLVLRVLSSFKQSEMEAAINKLQTATLDVLMKYIYRGFELPKESAQANLLIWHEKAFKVGGHGCIVRVLTDRKRV